MDQPIQIKKLPHELRKLISHKKFKDDDEKWEFIEEWLTEWIFCEYDENTILNKELALYCAEIVSYTYVEKHGGYPIFDIHHFIINNKNYGVVMAGNDFYYKPKIIFKAIFEM